tara:strand:- start:610 stop:1284 length:675 start_codon:yes stop_codon:yes gene_type:complete
MAPILLLALLLLSSHASATTIQWIPLGTTFEGKPETFEGNPGTIDGNPVMEFRNAGEGGIKWETTGIGPRGGRGVQELWLFDDSADIKRPGTSEAETTFSVVSNSVSFIMYGDHNDGYAQFFVDNIDVGIFDLYKTGFRNLVVTGLDSITHNLRIVQLGRHRPQSTKGDVAIIGGAAFNTTLSPATTISEPSILGLFLISFLYFWGCFMSKIYNTNRSNFVLKH